METRPGRRAQLMLLANLEIGFHEQTRLQPEIQQAMEAAPDTADDLKSRLPVVRLLFFVLTPFVNRCRRFARLCQGKVETSGSEQSRKFRF